MSPRSRTEVFEQALAGTIRAHHLVLGQGPQVVLAVVETIERAWNAGGKLVAFGNGGSAADAQHLAAELVGRFARDRRPLAALALSADTSVLTAIANDTSYNRVFARQIEALGRRGDVAFAISTSGTSRNVVAGLESARQLGLTTVALTGRDGGTVARLADVHVNVPETSTARVQEVHRTLLHVICELLEDAAG
ncbi:MAG TPA: SIS domain-containing protein [Vicinamibacterales bacterium]|jgi:D-sedoheptulose 7-phosphate isomerase